MDIRLYIKLNIYYLKRGRQRDMETDIERQRHVYTHQETKQKREGKMATKEVRSGWGVGVVSS